MICLENYVLVAITETWWDESHDWHTVIEGYRLFRMDRQGRRGGRVALYVRKWIGCKELCLRNSHDQVESLWVKIRDRSSKGQLVVGVCYRLGGLKLARLHEGFWPGQESTSTIPTALKKAAPRAAAPGIRPRPRTAQRSVVPPAERSGSSQAALAIAACPHTALRSGPRGPTSRAEEAVTEPPPGRAPRIDDAQTRTAGRAHGRRARRPPRSPCRRDRLTGPGPATAHAAPRRSARGPPCPAQAEQRPCPQPVRGCRVPGPLPSPEARAAPHPAGHGRSRWGQPEGTRDARGRPTSTKKDSRRFLALILFTILLYNILWSSSSPCSLSCLSGVLTEHLARPFPPRVRCSLPLPPGNGCFCSFSGTAWRPQGARGRSPSSCCWEQLLRDRQSRPGPLPRGRSEAARRSLAAARCTPPVVLVPVPVLPFPSEIGKEELRGVREGREDGQGAAAGALGRIVTPQRPDEKREPLERRSRMRRRRRAIMIL